MKKAIVTGASGGIGGQIAIDLARAGYFVFAQYNKNKSGVDKIISDLEKEGVSGTVCALEINLSDLDSITRGINKVNSSFSSIDLIVNCAGVGLYKLASETTEKEWSDLFSVNVSGMHILTSKLLGGMISNKSGKIINISSVWGNVGASMEVAYSASKSAIIGYTKALAKEVAPSNITVNCVCPGVIDTAMNSRFSKEEMDELVNSTPLNRLGCATDVSNLVLFLASDKADFITGQIITVDGGFTL